VRQLSDVSGVVVEADPGVREAETGRLPGKTILTPAAGRLPGDPQQQ
jgi:hypothetical protein